MDILEIKKRLQGAVKDERHFLLEECRTKIIETEDGAERNALALLISDYKADFAVETIIELLKSEKTKGNRGTLLYALSELDYGKHIDFISNLIFDKNFEVKMEALKLVKGYLTNMQCGNAGEKRCEFITQITSKLDDLNDEMSFLIYAVDCLSGKNQDKGI